MIKLVICGPSSISAGDGDAPTSSDIAALNTMVFIGNEKLPIRVKRNAVRFQQLVACAPRSITTGDGFASTSNCATLNTMVVFICN